MLISVIAKEDNAEVLLELQALQFLAVNIKFTYLFALLSTLSLLAF